ncbi:MAG: acetate--CoA ligase family protein [Candidatus Jordarchaeum sp.]|uniref:acetate--CoA ligase family protein n=1 Tax=Candidatus Jordarchaeum sp. TaxID=2823881 RepID=UPI004049F091
MGRQESDFDALFKPRNIAVVGASNTFGKIGGATLAAVLSGEFRGEIYPVNPYENEVLGLKTYPNISSIPGDIDLVVLTVPANTALEVLRECERKGVKACIMITAGFKEVGGEGEKMQNEVSEIGRRSGMKIVGPNCMGVYSASGNLIAIMSPVNPNKGNIAMVSQSGTLGMVLMDSISRTGAGFTKFVSSGNEAVLKLEDYLDYYSSDLEARVVVAFIEGVRDGKRFRDIARELSRKKPFIAIKAGKTKAGSEAAHSHTSSIAGSIQVFRSVAKQTGIILAENSDELVDYATAFAKCPLPEGRRVGILSGAGGWAVLSADACEEYGLQVPPLPANVVDKISELAPSYWSRRNPIDLVSSLDINLFKLCGEILFEEDVVDTLLYAYIAYDFSSSFDPLSKISIFSEEEIETFKKGSRWFMRTLAESASSVSEKYGKPVLFVTRDSEVYNVLRNSRVPVFGSPIRAVKCIAKMVEYQEYLERIMKAENK